MADSPAASRGSAPTPARRPRVRHRLRTPQEARQWRRRAAGYAIAGLAFLVVVNALVGENGYLATMRAAREQAEADAKVAAVRRENQQLKDKIYRMKTDPAELEDAARRDLHLSKPGETMIVIKDPPKPTPSPAPREPGR